VPKLKVIFAGTPDFAASSLTALLAHPSVTVIAVYTQPDKPAGRGQQLRESAVKTLAIAQGLPIFQPHSLRDAETMASFAALQADLLVVAAYGQILPAGVLEAPRLGSINVHASLLPRWRGAAPIQRAIMAGDRESGITIMRMVERLDAGPMILQSRCPIAATDTGGTLHDRLAEMGGAALVAGIDCLLAPTHEELEQAEDLVTYARKIERADRQIDWQRSAVEIARQIRALHPGPLASTSLAGITANIVTAEVMAESAGEPGQVTLKGETLEIHTGAGALKILTLQPAGKNVMAAREFINGYRQRLLA